MESLILKNLIKLRYVMKKKTHIDRFSQEFEYLCCKKN